MKRQQSLGGGARGFLPLKGKNSFTFAEVLVTLGIIGVVASLTLPTLIQNSRNSEVETSLKKIYSTMNQAILMSESQNGPRKYWPFCPANDMTEDCVNFYNKYIIKYLKNVDKAEISTPSQDYYFVYLADGSMLAIKGTDFFYFPHAKNYNPDTFANRDDCGKTYFAFRLETENTANEYNKNFEPYKKGLKDYTKEALTDPSTDRSCNKVSTNKVFCTALIQLNNWKIPKDYPFKVK